MRKSFKQLIQIFFDNKEYFIRCTFMAVIAALILRLAIGFGVPSSAEESSTIIEAGTYQWNENLNLSTLPNGVARLEGSFSFPPSSGVFNGVSYTISVSSIVEGVSLSLTDISTYEGPLIAFGNNSAENPITLSIDTADGTQTLDGSFIFPYYGGNWGSIIETTDFNITGSELGSTFIINEDIVIDDVDLSTWFFANTTNISYVDPDPVIQAGYYKVRDSWNTSGWPVTNDSIEFRYFDEISQSYIEAEGLAFLIESVDMVSIWYMDANVYLDGWNSVGAKFIEVTQDITVEPEFYTAFNNIYETSSQGSNEFESGYAAGYNDGFSVGRDVGYNQGYYEGMAESSGNFFTDILGGVLGSLDSFTLFGGYSLLDLLTTLLGGFALIWILKLLAGG